MRLNSRHFVLSWLFLAFISVSLLPSVLFSGVSAPLQDASIRNTLFKEAEKKLHEAQKEQADLLAPKSFKKAMEFYSNADKNFERGKNLDGIKKKLKGAVSYFQKAIDATRIAKVTFQKSLKARSDAQKAEAPAYLSEAWQKAEKKFEEAASKLEEGNIKSARRKSSEAEGLYREAELGAIKANYLNETRDLLAAAKNQKVEDYAPLTLRHAESLVLEAEKELNENRYDTDVARNLAQRAEAEARHAIYLAKLLRSIKKSKTTHEEILLSAEEPLRSIASQIEEVAAFDEGFGKPTRNIIRYIKTMQDSLQTLSQNLSELRQQLDESGQRVAELEEKLGIAAEEKSTLSQRMEIQAKIREQFAKVEKMFTPAEARVFRQKNKIIVRLIGLKFASGKSVLEPQFFSLLTKVQDAIKTFPGGKVVVEGHTDSFGGDQLNQRLSEKRAKAVEAYLLANMDLPQSRISSTGYGENRPIANNGTAEGRSRNRRIDIVIEPNLPALNADNSTTK